MGQNTFAEQVRKTFIQLRDAGQAEIDNQSLALQLDLISDKDKKPLRSTLRDFVKSGEIECIRPNVYAYKGKSGQPDIRSAMWAVMRMRKTVTKQDLQELSGASADYAKEFISLLQRRGVIELLPAKRTGSAVYRLVNDTGPQPPEDSEKAARLKKIRAAKKAALELIEAAGNDLIAASQKLMAARIAVNDLPEEAPNGNDK